MSTSLSVSAGGEIFVGGSFKGFHFTVTYDQGGLSVDIREETSVQD